MKSAGLGGCLVSNNILHRTGRLKWCVRENASRPIDNGWRFLSDKDTSEFLNEPSNWSVCDWNTVVEIEPAILTIFSLPVGTELTLQFENGKRWFEDTNTGERVEV